LAQSHPAATSRISDAGGGSSGNGTLSFPPHVFQVALDDLRVTSGDVYGLARHISCDPPGIFSVVMASPAV